MKTYEEWEQIKNAPKYTVEQITDYLVDRLSAAELLAVTYHLHLRVQKELGYLYDRCTRMYEEDYESQEKAYNEGVAQMQQEAGKILENELNWRFDEQPDLLNELDIHLF